MPAFQSLLFPDPQPLVERLGRDFFRQLPESPGVYLMHDRDGTLLYVGKAKNLRKRLGSYRVANPDRLRRRHLRLLGAVTRIDLELCPDEGAALAREAELLRTLRPPFNRAGTWPGLSRFLGLHCRAPIFCLKLMEDRPADWLTLGPMGQGAVALRAMVARLLWFAFDPERVLSAMPAGWMHNQLEPETSIDGGAAASVMEPLLRGLFSGDSAPFCAWVRQRIPDSIHPFHRQWLTEDLEGLEEMMSSARLRAARSPSVVPSQVPRPARTQRASPPVLPGL